MLCAGYPAGFHFIVMIPQRQGTKDYAAGRE
jgi:hypothetical protein